MSAEPVECPICQNEIGKPDEDGTVEGAVVNACCGRTLGSNCLSKWLEGANTCPMCRAVIAEAPARPFYADQDRQAAEDVLQEFVLRNTGNHLMNLAGWIIDAFVTRFPVGVPRPSDHAYENDLWPFIRDTQTFMRSWSSAYDESIAAFRHAIDAYAANHDLAGDLPTSQFDWFQNIIAQVDMQPTVHSNSFQRDLFRLRPVIVIFARRFAARLNSRDAMSWEDLLHMNAIVTSLTNHVQDLEDQGRLEQSFMQSLTNEFAVIRLRNNDAEYGFPGEILTAEAALELAARHFE